MFRNLLRRVTVLAIAFAFGCGGDGINTDLSFPETDLANSTTSDVSSQVLNLASGVPEGRRITFLGDEIVISGKNYVPNLKVMFGVNHEIQRRPNSLLMPRARQPRQLGPRRSQRPAKAPIRAVATEGTVPRRPSGSRSPL